MYLVAEDPDGSRALLPLMEVDSWLTGRRGVSLPFTDECQPLCHDPDAFAGLMAAATGWARSRHWRYVELRGGRSQMPNVPASARFYGHTLDLRRPAALFSGCGSAARGAVRKAVQSGLEIQFLRSLEAMRAFHGLLCQTRKRHGVPPQPFRFFENVHRHVLAANQGVIVMASLDHRPVAAAVYFHFGPSVLYKYAASDETFHHLRPNNLVMWRAIEWHAAAGYTSLDFGRTAQENEGLRRFKLAWGTEERLVEYVRYNQRTNNFATAANSSSGWQREVLKALPRTLLRLIGTAAYRHVA